MLNSSKAAGFSGGFLILKKSLYGILAVFRGLLTGINAEMWGLNSERIRGLL